MKMINQNKKCAGRLEIVMCAALVLTVVAAMATSRSAGNVTVNTERPVVASTGSDCRIPVATDHYLGGSQASAMRILKMCPHKDKLAAGKCEYDFPNRRLRCAG